MSKKYKSTKLRYQKTDDFNTQFEEKVLYINRCSKTIKGGRKMSFSALILVADKQGHLGCGFAKANELTDAIQKAGESARKRIITVNLDGSTIPHEICVKSGGAKVLLKPAKAGTGVIAGSKTRVILESVGIHDVVAKNFGSNPMNLVHAVIEALESLISREEYQKLRGTL
ncbi:MAG: rpsE [Chlamydiales bacterium]|jgi:small subunit ribosomal protein S5|nr:rpsE [Chlamydiales bacterium]